MSMKSIKEIRRHNLGLVLDLYCERNQTIAANKLGYSTPSLVNRYITGAKAIGDNTARKIEETFALQQFWMDTDHSSSSETMTKPAVSINVRSQAINRGTGHDANVSAAAIFKGEVPLISWVQAGAWGGETFTPEDAESWLLCPSPHSEHAFALTVRGVSMQPKYQDGDVIFVDPAVSPQHGKNVVVKLASQEQAIFRHLVVEGDKMFLQALNPDWPGPKLTELEPDDEIKGVVIGRYVPE